MARKSQRLSATATTPNSTHKRAASNTSLAAVRTKKSKATPTKSQYFSDHETGDEKRANSHGDVDDLDGDDEVSSAPEDEISEFESAPESADDDGDENDDEEYGSESDRPKVRRKSSSKKSATGTTRSSTKSTKGSELWREGVKTGLGPGQQIIIKKPKARPAGKVPYTDDTIHPNTLLFLKDLKGNNNREWLKMHDPDFRQSEKDWFSFVEKLTERLAEIDDTIPELPVKDIIFRIYRDVRFSKDPTPYKPFFSAAWSRTGRKGPYAHYYIQVSPDQSFVGGGLWHPEAAPTASMRRAIDRRSRQLKDVLLDDKLRKEFLKGAPKNDAKAVKAFVASNSENALKTRPKGFDADHPDIDLLRLRNYTIGRTLSEQELLGAGGFERVAELFGAMKPFITYLNSVVMPDEEEDSDGSEDGEDDEASRESSGAAESGSEGD